MMVATVGSIPLGRASDVWGRRRLLLAGMAISAVTSLVLPLTERTVPLALVYGAAGLGVAAFTPSTLSMVGDAAGTEREGPEREPEVHGYVTGFSLGAAAGAVGAVIAAALWARAQPRARRPRRGTT
jgi:MFS family permease